MKTRFDLEDDIMQCWRTSDDIKIILDNLEGASEDTLMNSLIGLETLHEMRMQRLFRTFSAMIATGGFQHNNPEP